MNGTLRENLQCVGQERERERGREGERREKIIQPGNPLNLADILKQAFIFRLNDAKCPSFGRTAHSLPPPPNTRDNGGESRNTVAALRRPKSAWNCNTQPTAESLSIYIPLFLARATAPWNHHAYSGCACLTLPVGLLGVHACGAGSGAAFKTESGSVINSVFLYERRRAIFFFLHSQRKW